ARLGPRRRGGARDRDGRPGRGPRPHRPRAPDLPGSSPRGDRGRSRARDPRREEEALRDAPERPPAPRIYSPEAPRPRGYLAGAFFDLRALVDATPAPLREGLVT